MKSAALATKDDKNALACSVNAANTLTNTTVGVAAAPSGNTSASIQPTDTSIPTTPSGGKGGSDVQEVTSLQVA